MMNHRNSFRRSLQSSRLGLLVLFLGLAAGPASSGVFAEDTPSKAREVLQASIDAMGGSKYLNVRNSVSSGRYFFFRKGRKAFTRFHDWTVYAEPVRWRFQLGKGKRQNVRIFHLGLGKGWTLEGEDSVEEATEEELKDFKRNVKRDLDYILRTRRNDPDIKLFYYGPDDIEGDGQTEAVELLDTDNDSVVMFFNIDSHLPTKVETFFTDKLGFRHKEESEFYNWHWIEGVQAPLRFDSYVDGELSQQRYLEELSFNQDIPDSYFLEPVVKEKKD